MTDLVLSYPILASMVIVVAFWRLTEAIIDRRDNRAAIHLRARGHHRR